MTTPAEIASTITARLTGDGPWVVGLAGPVAVGKTTLADALVAAFDRPAEVVSTDGFLLPNAELERRGLMMRKGFPESYDLDGMRAFIEEVRAGCGGSAPRYSHVVYDVDPVERQIVDAAIEIVLLEGVVALQDAVATSLDLAVYLDAPDDSVRSWYVARFLELVDAAAADETSFYRRFANLDADGRRAMAEGVWDGINAPNLSDHIEPTKRNAHIVITKAADHAVVDVGPPGEG